MTDKRTWTKEKPTLPGAYWTRSTLTNKGASLVWLLPAPADSPFIGLYVRIDDGRSTALDALLIMARPGEIEWCGPLLGPGECVPLPEDSGNG